MDDLPCLVWFVIFYILRAIPKPEAYDSTIRGVYAILFGGKLRFFLFLLFEQKIVFVIC